MSRRMNQTYFERYEFDLNFVLKENDKTKSLQTNIKKNSAKRE